MGKTTFTGPIKAGNILQTSGTTVGKDVKNVGFASMAQSQAVTQTTSTGQATGVFKTDLVIPANSHILDIQFCNTVGWSGAATVDIGYTAGGAEFVATLASPAVGITITNPGTDATRAGIWDDVGTTDRRIWVKSSATGSGVGTLSVRYIQAQDTV